MVDTTSFVAVVANGDCYHLWGAHACMIFDPRSILMFSGVPVPASSCALSSAAGQVGSTESDAPIGQVGSVEPVGASAAKAGFRAIAGPMPHSVAASISDQIRRLSWLILPHQPTHARPRSHRSGRILHGLPGSLGYIVRSSLFRLAIALVMSRWGIIDLESLRRQLTRRSRPQHGDSGESSDDEVIYRVLTGRLVTFKELLLQLTEEGTRIDPVRVRMALDRLSLKGRIESMPGVRLRNPGVAVCSRCGAVEEVVAMAGCPRCGKPCYSCLRCRSMGEMTACTLLYRVVEQEVLSHLDNQSRSTDSALTGPRAGRCCVSGTESTEREEIQISLPYSLSPAQSAASADVLEFVRSGGRGEYLIWAACGAGKTEVVLEAIRYALTKGNVVLYVVPRSSIASEIYDRLRTVLPGVPMSLTTGQRRDHMAGARLLLMTAHQTLRFKSICDLLIFDEADAFPCTEAGYLTSSVLRSVKESGQVVYLTATPTRSLYQRALSGTVRHFIIPVRHHGRPLPEPNIIFADSMVECVIGSNNDEYCFKTRQALLSLPGVLTQCARNGAEADAVQEPGGPLSDRLRTHRVTADRATVRDKGAATKSRADGCRLGLTALSWPGGLDRSTVCTLCRYLHDEAPYIIFVPTRRRAESLCRFLDRVAALCWPDRRVGLCHSRTGNVADALARLKEGYLGGIVSTTVLERGITVRRVNVIVIDADSHVFDCRSLVQMAGRPGRTTDAPTGDVYFSVHQMSDEVATAVSMIKRMNEEAQRWGVLGQ